MKRRPSMTEEKKMSMTYVQVHDNAVDHGKEKWISTKCVQMYPHLYTPVQYKGIIIEAEILDVNPYGVRT
jgi:uncharacterized protein (DUF952 family)